MTEKLSNLMDEKIDQADLDDFLAAYKDDPELAKRWQRYHIAQDLIKNEISDRDLQFDIAAKVMAKISADPNEVIKQDLSTSKVVEFPAKTTAHAKKPWWPMAIAASMLLGLYFIVQQPLQQPKVTNQIAEVATETDPMSMPHWQTDNAAIEDALNALLVEHSEFTSVTGMNGLGSYSKFVSYQKL